MLRSISDYLMLKQTICQNNKTITILLLRKISQINNRAFFNGCRCTRPKDRQIVAFTEIEDFHAHKRCTGAHFTRYQRELTRAQTRVQLQQVSVLSPEANGHCIMRALYLINRKCREVSCKATDKYRHRATTKRERERKREKKSACTREYFSNMPPQMERKHVHTFMVLTVVAYEIIRYRCRFLLTIATRDTYV